MNISRMLIRSAMLVSNRKRGEPVKRASKKPTQGTINGASKIPSKSTACLSSIKPRPRMAPQASENTNNSMDGNARLASEPINSACPSASVGIISLRVTRLRRPRCMADGPSCGKGDGSVGTIGSSGRDIGCNYTGDGKTLTGANNLDTMII